MARFRGWVKNKPFYFNLVAQRADFTAEYLFIFISCFFRFLTQTSMNAKSEATIVTKMRTVPTFLAHITARAGLATQEMGAFVMV